MIKNRVKKALPLMALLALTACKKSGQNEPEPAVYQPREITAGSKAFVSALFEYVPAPGQFINKAPGNEESARSVLGGRNGLVSLGAWGGYVVFGFDHSVKDQAGADLMIYGNAFPNFAEPGVVWVMQDTNNNGKPDDTWYAISGSETGKAGYVRDYTVTYTRPADDKSDISWTDNQGNSGKILHNSFHQQMYFPQWISGNSYTLSGVLLPSSNIDKSIPSNIKSLAFASGYADNTAGGDAIDIADAVDADGKKAAPGAIDFIKIQTGVMADLGWLGELSTEVSGVADLHLLNNQ
ncbi:MAG: cell surface protein [Mucilaginibacter polytrichastri]|nr:cell surface protein [Mucilaginibacter polytrichastri]